ncbi:MAG: WYL domain-containing protein [Lachnospiraceae bacterium]|nr:WYL domain-containing protein [Lachnospiraceae bacterium]
MSRGTNQKFKFTYLMRVMLEKTDDDHALTMSQIMEELDKYDVTAERKSIYADFQDMTERFGIEIIKEQIGRETYYHVGSREFELAEVKLLVDAIQSSKFITQTKSRELITKIKGFVSEHQGKTLQRQVFIDDRVKTMNESVFYNVDEVYTAINENKKIRFKYYKWDINKKLVARRDGEWFVLSPWGLTWVDENYYMIAYDEWDGKVKSYRVDKMMRISITDEKRTGQKEFKEYDMSKLSKSTFGMYGGPKERVKIQFENSMCGVFLDRFGKDDISFRPVGDNWSEFSVEVNVSQHFFGWLFGLGPKVKLVGPHHVVDELKEYVAEYTKSME